ncbi:inner membrane protein [Paenibacillus sp. UNCCL117]|uniref:metal-dependent hydrolase n=1 Tax=unclassified Paenibacillus TaxID=185978 RepID=UPI00088E5DF5|nr:MULTISPECIES: metal-dependent hydrolase [unclassified Paenibacillus]SDE02174.1 inner membrane protein [Paenibacillus sp. cl123]SFW57162.1 inner membrane protein [Paenibacillus sp. UNCCL117]
MDTGTHLVIGLGLAGLAYIDPVVAADPAVATAVLIGTVAGSQAPDADTLLRLKNNAVYIKNHRGKSHSLPALLLWTALISGFLWLVFDGLPMLHVTMWVLIAVAFHVFTDLFNTYGTQALRPFSERWVSWNIIHIFDPFMFLAHVLAVFLWAVHVLPPQTIFPILYGMIAVYYVWRSWVHYRLESRLHLQDPEYEAGERYTLIPTVHLYNWQIVKRRKDGSYRLGEFRNNRIQWVDQVRCAAHPAVEASKSHPNVASFLYFTSFACAELKEHPWGYEVRWADVRYRHRKQYPFVAVLRMDKSYETLDSYVGWMNDTKLEKKLRVDMN